MNSKSLDTLQIYDFTAHQHTQQQREKALSQGFVPFGITLRHAAAPSPPSSSLCLRRKKVSPDVPKPAPKSLCRTKHPKPAEGYKLGQEKVKPEPFALCGEGRDGSSLSHGFECLAQISHPYNSL